MLPDKVKDFAAQTHRGVLTTFRRNGAAQMSIISCGPYRDGIAFTVTESRVKLKNLRRNPRCTSWWWKAGQRYCLRTTQTPKSSKRLSGTPTAPARERSTPTGKNMTKPCGTIAAR